MQSYWNAHWEPLWLLFLYTDLDLLSIFYSRCSSFSTSPYNLRSQLTLSMQQMNKIVTLWTLDFQNSSSSFANLMFSHSFIFPPSSLGQTNMSHAYKGTLYHMIPTDTPHLTPIRSGAKLWNEFLCCKSVSWQVTPAVWRRRDKDRQRVRWWRGYEGGEGGGWSSHMRIILGKREDRNQIGS